MTTTAPASKKPAARKPAAAKKAAPVTKPVASAGIGRVARVTGPVVDIEFPHDEIPAVYNALKTTITIGGESTRSRSRSHSTSATTSCAPSP
jgi:F-type H+-transporting ATPase subunit beta